MVRAETSELETLREIADRVRLRRAHLAFAQAELELATVKAFVKYRHNPETHVICLNCGRFNLGGVACACREEIP